MHIRILHNTNVRAIATGYAPDDAVVEVLSYEDTGASTAIEAADTACGLSHGEGNPALGTPDRRALDGRVGSDRCMSNGDVVAVDGEFYARTPAHWERVAEPKIVTPERLDAETLGTDTPSPTALAHDDTPREDTLPIAWPDPEPKPVGGETNRHKTGPDSMEGPAFSRPVSADEQGVRAAAISASENRCGDAESARAATPGRWTGERARDAGVRPVGEVVAELLRGLEAEAERAFVDRVERLMGQEVEARCGPRGARSPSRTATREGYEIKMVPFRDRSVAVRVPRMRELPGTGTRRGRSMYPDIFMELVATGERDRVVQSLNLAGVSTRGQVGVSETLGVRGGSRSTRSRTFTHESLRQLEEITTMRLDGVRLAGLEVDGTEVGGRTVVVALGIRTDGTKLPLGLAEDQTESEEMVSGLLADLVGRGLDVSGVLWIVDGGQQLTSAIMKLTDGRAAIQRCIVHKARNVTGAKNLSKEAVFGIGQRVRGQILQGWKDRDPDRGLKLLKELARELDRSGHKPAAAAVRQGIRRWAAIHTSASGPSALDERAREHADAVVDQLPPDARDGIGDQITSRLHRAWSERSYERAVGLQEALARDLDGRGHAAAAASVREGMESTHTVTALGVNDVAVRKALQATQALERANGTIRRWTSRPRRWTDGNMRRRWVAAGLSAAAGSWKPVENPEELGRMSEAVRRRAWLNPLRAKVGERRAETIGARAAALGTAFAGRSDAWLRAQLAELEDPAPRLDEKRARATLRAESYALVLAERIAQVEQEADRCGVQAGRLQAAEREAALSAAKLKHELADALRVDLARLNAERERLQARTPPLRERTARLRLPLDQWIEDYGEISARWLALEQAIREIAIPRAAGSPVETSPRERRAVEGPRDAPDRRVETVIDGSSTISSGSSGHP